jgi:hypothetical protein
MRDAGGQGRRYSEWTRIIALRQSVSHAQLPRVSGSGRTAGSAAGTVLKCLSGEKLNPMNRL